MAKCYYDTPYDVQQHLLAMFSANEQVSVRRGRLDRLEAIEREVRAIKDWSDGVDLDRALIQGSAIRSLLDLLGSYL